MKKIFGLVLGAMLLPLSVAHAADVTVIYTNNMFASAVSTDAAGNTTGVFVSRVKGKGEPVDSIQVIISDAFGNSQFVTGTLPKNAFKVSAQKASLDVDIADIEVTASSGSLSGEVIVDWTAGDVTRESGNTKFSFGNTTVMFVGTATSASATVTGSVDGAPLVNPVGDLSKAHDSLHIHVSQN